ncbi:MAG: BspA family leucine-rich repeat surface protein [Fulvivirga sp.]
MKNRLIISKLSMNLVVQLFFAGYIMLHLSAALSNLHAQTPSFEWAGGFGGTGNDAGFSIATDVAGNVFSTGKFSGTADFDPGVGTYNLISAGSEDAYFSKLDASGNLVWAYGFGSTSLDRGLSIAVDPFGNVIITGEFRNTIDFDPGPGTFNLTAPSGLADFFILKLDNDGNFIWAVSIGDPASNADLAYSLATDDFGSVYITGIFGETVDFDPGVSTFLLTPVSGGGFRDVFILKLDESGNFIWAKSIGGTSSDIAFALTVDLSNNVIIGGHFYGTVDFDPGPGVNNITTTGSKNLFILKLDTNGDFVWAKNLISSTSDLLLGVATDADDNVFVTGEFFTSIDLDPGPGSFTETEVSGGDIFILKLDAAGDFLWGAGIGDNQEDSGRAIAVDADGNSYFTGHYAGTVDFDPGPGVFNLSSTTSNTYDIFISKYDPSGNFLWAGSMGGLSDFELGAAITVDSHGNIYLTGDFYNEADFDPGSGVFNLTGNGTQVDAFVVKLSIMPTITSFSPNSGSIGTSVIITGTNFSTTPANNVVTFNGTPAVVTASTANSITTTVPVGATTGKISVNVDGNTATSTDDFTITTSQNFITQWNLATAGSGATQLSFGTATSGTVNYAWQEISPGSATGSGSWSGSTLTITGLPAGATIRLQIDPTNFQRIIINNGTDRNRLTQVEQWGSAAWTSMQTAFRSCVNLQITAIDIPDLSGVTNISQMFQGCSVLNSPSNINGWNTATVTNMSNLFADAVAFNQNIGAWNTAAVTNMAGMFMGALMFNQNISTWNTSAVTNMNSMFYSAYRFNQNIGGWNTSAVTNMSSMFGTFAPICGVTA